MGIQTYSVPKKHWKLYNFQLNKAELLMINIHILHKNE